MKFPDINPITLITIYLILLGLILVTLSCAKFFLYLKFGTIVI